MSKSASKKVSLRERCAQLEQEFSPILAARARAAKAKQIANNGKSWKFRLAQLVSMDSRAGTIVEVGASAGFKAASIVDTMIWNDCNTGI